MVLLSGCEKEYPANLQYTFSPYTRKISKTITIKREADGRLAEVLAAGQAPTVSEIVLVALAGDLQPSQQKSVGVDAAETLTMPPEEQTALNEALKEYFGTPRDPKVDISDAAIIDDPEMQLQPEHLKKGSQLYRQLCLYCHGINGDGGGPTGYFLNPKPRDFRRGIFKFRSTVKYDPSTQKVDPPSQVAPSFDDIRRTLQRGAPTASMPSFNMLSDQQLDALVSYVIHLSLRGMTEYQVVTREKELSELEEAVLSSAKRWLYGSARAGPGHRLEKVLFIPPEPPKGWGDVLPAGAKLEDTPGFKAYRGDGKCLECHWTDGRSNPLDVPTNLTRMNDWGQLNPPRNLTYGVFRGGARPVDVYWRIKLGVGGSGMPAASDTLTDEQIWHLVDYVMTLPTQQR
jgi:mono/diheme cytochrome c family protein